MSTPPPMPGIQQVPTLSLDALQNYSINSILGFENGAFWALSGTTMAGGTLSELSDLLGLNSPRGLLNIGSSDPWSVATPPLSPENYQNNFDEVGFYSPELGTFGKNLQRNISSGSVGSNLASPPFLCRGLRSVSLSDSCGSNSSALFEPPSYNRNLSTDFNLTPGSNNSDIVNILNSLPLRNSNDNLSRNLLGASASSDLDLQNFQAVQALKFLQQQSINLPPQPSMLPNPTQLVDKWHKSNSLLSSVAESTTSQLQDRAVRIQRLASVSEQDTLHTWNGVLPARTERQVGFSSKIFLGGVPWDISEQCLIQTFSQFGPVKVEWPGKENQASQPKGYAYLILESEKNVKMLLQACSSDNAGKFFFKIGSRRMKSKDIEIIPWFLSDSSYVTSPFKKLDPTKTVFVGGLHGMLTAQGLAKIMNDVFDGVIYIGIDTDKYKYPIGSGRVTFNNSRSYIKAVTAGFIKIKTAKFTKKVQIDPYIEESLCSVCGVQKGPYFCRDFVCYRYYCRFCWSCMHSNVEICHHKPMSRNSKSNQLHQPKLLLSDPQTPTKTPIMSVLDF